MSEPADIEMLAAALKRAGYAVVKVPEPEWERTRWLQMLDGAGKIWMETSSPGEVRGEVAKHPDWPVYRLYKRVISEYEQRPITPEDLEADCASEDEWYRKAVGDV